MTTKPKVPKELEPVLGWSSETGTNPGSYKDMILSRLIATVLKHATELGLSCM
jgi:hypothetical protein